MNPPPQTPQPSDDFRPRPRETGQSSCSALLTYLSKGRVLIQRRRDSGEATAGLSAAPSGPGAVSSFRDPLPRRPDAPLGRRGAPGAGLRLAGVRGVDG